MFRIQGKPVWYMYDSHQIAEGDWADIIGPHGSNTVRYTALDGFFFGLWINRDSGERILDSWFDGFFTHFASTGLTFGSTLANWPSMQAFADTHGLAFSATVAPGYDDRALRQWNTHSLQSRADGKYYEDFFAAAAKAHFVSVNSFNEWGDGTQIEPAVPHAGSVEANGYGAQLAFHASGPTKYLQLTQKLVFGFVSGHAHGGIDALKKFTRLTPHSEL